MSSHSGAAAPPPLPKGLDESTVYRTLFMANPDALLVADASGLIVLANPAAHALLGYAEGDLVGMNVDVLVPEVARSGHAAHRHSYMQAPRTRPMGTDMELVAQRRDGAQVRVEIALSPLQDHGLPLVVAAIRDVGTYPRVKQALQRARYSEHLAQVGRTAVDARDPRVLLEQLPAVAAQALQVDVAIVYLLEPDRQDFRIAGGVGMVAPDAVGARVANRQDTPPGFVLAEAAPVIVQDYSHETRFDVPRAYLDAGLTSGLAVPLLDRGRTIGTLTVRSRSPKRFGHDEVRFLESLSNLLATSLQRAQSEEALKHAQRLESVGQLTGGIAHDFNNLLTVIQGNLQVLEDLPLLGEDAYAQRLVAAATRASKRGAELTGKLLAFSRRQVLQPNAVDVHALLHSLADMLRRTLDQRIRIELDVPLDCPPVLADPGQLESALLNIAINARDAMHQGGTLRFRAHGCARLPDEVLNALDDPSAPQDGFVAISISDTGTGMPEAVKERAFEPFFTTKEAGRGTGLGLATVYGFVKQSKGAIALESATGVGTQLTLYIPRPWESQTPAVEGDAEASDLTPGLNVLLVEDDAEVRAVVHTFLLSLGCRVQTAISAEQALLLLTPEADFDVLLSDIALGAGMRGTELASVAQQRLPRLAVLLMSGFSSELLEADREAPPSWDLLRKPYGRDELAQALARLTQTRG